MLSCFAADDSRFYPGWLKVLPRMTQGFAPDLPRMTQGQPGQPLYRSKVWYCVRFGKLKLIAKCPCSCLDSKKGPMFRLETISLDYTVHGKIGPQLNQYKSSRQSRHWKTHIENVHFDSHNSSCQTQRSWTSEVQWAKNEIIGICDS